MAVQYALTFIIIIAFAGILRINYVTDKSRRASLEFWQQRFNTVAADYRELIKINEELNESTKLLSKEVFTCEFNRRNK